MHIYLPIAELSVNVFLILGLGGGVGLLSGLFGVGGGFLMTPLLIFVGIPSPVAVATEANQIVASSVSGVLAHWRRGADPYSWDHFRHAFLRNKVAQGLYHPEPGNLIFLGNRLFRTEVHFPANVSVGTFGIDVHLIRKGELVATETTLLNVRKFGLEASIFSFAHRHSFAYGVIAVLTAGFAGWAANAAFRKA